MKRYLKYIGILVFSLVGINAQSQIGFPKFTLGADFQPCDSSCTANPNGPANPGPSVPGGIIVACKNQSHTYTVYPNLPAYSYTWTVLGGSPASFLGNPNVITWGNTNQ